MRALCVLFPIALLLSACGGTTKKSVRPAAPLQTVQVTEKEFLITPSTISLAKTGTYTFKVTNNGQITHAFELNGQRTSDIAPGQSAALTVDLSKKGTFDAYCPIDGHRSKGMQAKIAVGGSAPATTSTSQTTTTTSSSPGY